MNLITTTLKKHSLTYIFLNIYIAIQLLFPKGYSNIFGLPVRLILTAFLIIIIFIEIKLKKIKINKSKNKLAYFLFLLFLLCCIPSLTTTKSLIISLYTIVKFASVFVLYLFISKIVFTEEEYKFIVKNFIICTLILSVVGIFKYAFNIDLMVIGSGIENYKGAKGRLNTTFYNTIYYSIYINFIFIFIIYFINKVKSKKNFWLLLILLCAIYANMLFTFTRSSIVIMFLSITGLFLLLWKLIFSKKTILILLVLVCITVSIPGAPRLVKKSMDDTYSIVTKAENLLSFLPIFSKSEHASKNEDEFIDYDKNSDFVDYSLQHREAFSKIAKKIAKDNLLTGVGFGSYLYYMESNDFSLKYPEYTLTHTHPHSAVILVFAETGILGLISLVLIVLFFIWKQFSSMINNYKKQQVEYEISSVAFVVSIGFLIINFMSENAIYDTQIFNAFAVIQALILSYCSRKENNRLLFISSTGGHLNEMMQLKPIIDKNDSYIITENTKSNISLKNKYEHVNFLIFGTKDHKLTYIFKFIANVFKSIYLYIRIKPKFIITTGTHTAVPMCYIGKLCGSKIIFIETFANSKTKTLAGQIVYPIADVFIVQWESMLKLYPKAIYGGWIY